MTGAPPRRLFAPDFDQQAAVVACAAFLDGIDGAHRDALVEAARRKGVIEFALPW